MCPHPEPPFHLPPHPIPQGHPSAPALSTLSYELNIVMAFAIYRRESATCILKFYLYSVTFLTILHEVVRQKGIML